MRKLILLYFFTAIAVWAQQMSIGSIAQKGVCAVAGVTGNVTINCPGVDPSVLRVLNEQFRARLKERDLHIDQITKDANEWKDRFLDLTTRLADAGVNDSLQRRAEELLKEGKLDEAGRVLDEVLTAEEKNVDQLAKNQFNRAAPFELSLEPLRALPHYEKAYNYRPNNPAYGQSYAILLYKQGDFGKAEVIFKGVLEMRREMAKGNPQYLPDVAWTLTNLGFLYRAIQRLKESEDALTEALQTYRGLAKANPQVYSYVAATLNGLGLLYDTTHRLKESADAYREALQTYRDLAKGNPQYVPDVAWTLTNLGVLYGSTQRLEESADADAEALQIRRELAKANPQAYLPVVALTLNSLGTLYKSKNQSTEAVPFCNEAAAILKQLAAHNPAIYSPLLSQVCND